MLKKIVSICRRGLEKIIGYIKAGVIYLCGKLKPLKGVDASEKSELTPNNEAVKDSTDSLPVLEKHSVAATTEEFLKGESLEVSDELLNPPYTEEEPVCISAMQIKVPLDIDESETVVMPERKCVKRATRSSATVEYVPKETSEVTSKISLPPKPYTVIFSRESRKLRNCLTEKWQEIVSSIVSCLQEYDDYDDIELIYDFRIKEKWLTVDKKNRTIEFSLRAMCEDCTVQFSDPDDRIPYDKEINTYPYLDEIKERYLALFDQEDTGTKNMPEFLSADREDTDEPVTVSELSDLRQGLKSTDGLTVQERVSEEDKSVMLRNARIHYSKVIADGRQVNFPENAGLYFSKGKFSVASYGDEVIFAERERTSHKFCIAAAKGLSHHYECNICETCMKFLAIAELSEDNIMLHHSCGVFMSYTESQKTSHYAVYKDWHWRCHIYKCIIVQEDDVPVFWHVIEESTMLANAIYYCSDLK